MDPNVSRRKFFQITAVGSAGFAFGTTAVARPAAMRARAVLAQAGAKVPSSSTYILECFQICLHKAQTILT